MGPGGCLEVDRSKLRSHYNQSSRGRDGVPVPIDKSTPYKWILQLPSQKRIQVIEKSPTKRLLEIRQCSDDAGFDPRIHKKFIRLSNVSYSQKCSPIDLLNRTI